MKRINTHPIAGAQELLPNLQAQFDQYKVGIANAYWSHGFVSIETPLIDRTEILLAKAGGDTEKQIYKLFKTAETADEADQALRFDHTVPLARYVVEHMNDLAFPFKVSQIGRNFRGERPQKGRFREFYQCDIDVIGWNELSINYDAEVIATLNSALKVLPFPNEYYFRISNRKILSGILEELNLEQFSEQIFNIVDHAEKLPAEKTIEALNDLGIGSEKVDKLLQFINIKGNVDEVIPALNKLGLSSETFTTGVSELEQVLRLLSESFGITSAIADMKIVRGLDYYTGTVFETFVRDFEKIGSVCSGGRYENLAGYYTDQKLPGVGGSIGLTRLFYILSDSGAISANDKTPVELCIVPISANEIPAASKLAHAMRNERRSVDLVLSGKKLGDKMKYAGKIANFVIVVGEDEVKTGHFAVKNLKNGDVDEFDFEV